VANSNNKNTQLNPKLTGENRMIKNKFGPAVRAARRAKNFSIPELADKIGLHFNYLTRLENGRVFPKPNIERIRKIAAVLDVDSNQLEEFAQYDYKHRPPGPDKDHRKLAEEERKDGQRHVNYTKSRCAELIYEARVKAGYSQAGLAKKLKIPETTFGHIEKGLFVIKYDKKRYQKITKVLDINYDTFLEAYIEDYLRHRFNSKKLTCKKLRPGVFRISLE
jgi:transcriptional regulator with XRE-family HTH domain